MKNSKFISYGIGLTFFIGLVLSIQEDIGIYGMLLMFISGTVATILLISLAFKKVNTMTLQGEEDMRAYKEIHERFGIPYNAKTIDIVSSDDISRFNVFTNKRCKAWVNEGILNLYHDEILMGVEVNDIKCFARVGDIKQGEYSISDAVVGYVLLGVAGAVIGGKKKAIDNRQTILVLTEKKEEECLVLSSDSYETLLSLIPLKELTVSHKTSE